MAINIDKERVQLVAHSSEWSRKFLREKEDLVRILPSDSCLVEHIGSTAVPGLTAKPIIDIATRLEDIHLIDELLEPLKELSYVHMGEFIAPRWHFLYKGNPREFNLHVVDGTTYHWKRWIQFRDILRQDETVRQGYEELKADLARKHKADAKSYREGKTEFIHAVLGTAALRRCH